MSHRTNLKRSPGLELLEGKCLLSTALPASFSAISGVASHQPGGPLAPLQATQAPCRPGPLFHSQHKPQQANGYTLVSVSTPLPAPVGRVQVDQTALVNGMSYTMSVLEVQNESGTAIGRGRFMVSVSGSSFKRSFPEQTWEPGKVLAFFAPASVQNFNFNLSGSIASIPPNVYFNVTYNPATFNATLHNLINSSHGVGGRFKLV